MDDPSNMSEIICDKYDKKVSNKMSNLSKDLESCTLRNTKFEPDDWITDLSHLNDRIENISIDLKKTEKQLEINIMNNMRKEYEGLKLVVHKPKSRIIGRIITVIKILMIKATTKKLEMRKRNIMHFM